MPNETRIEYARFLVGSRPCCVWKVDLEETNRRFVSHLDPSYFLYQAGVHRAALAEVGSDPAQPQAVHATLALRTSYGQALEAFFALIGALLQAPDCVFGWLASYRTEELKTLVRCIASGDDVPALPPFDRPSWKTISEALLAPLRETDAELFTSASAQFASAWANLASDFLNESYSFEYNCLKHGFRTEPLPAQLTITGPDELRIESRPQFSHSFPHLERMPKPHAPIHHQVSRTMIALDPQQLGNALELLSISMRNILSYLRARSGDESAQGFVPTDASFYQLSRFDGAPIIRFTLKEKATPTAPQEYFTAEEIIAIYNPADLEGSG